MHRTPDNFKIRASAIAKIMSPSKFKGELSQTCKTYLQTWLADEQEEIDSRYLAKGNAVENKIIDMIELTIGNDLGLFALQKNEKHFNNDFVTGTPDVVAGDIIIDAKASWSLKTFNDTVLTGLKDDYYWQMQGYMALTGASKAYVYHGLVNTPAKVNLGNEVIYEHLPLEQRFVSFEVLRDYAAIKSIYGKVEQCKAYLKQYHETINTRIGHILNANYQPINHKVLAI